MRREGSFLFASSRSKAYEGEAEHVFSPMLARAIRNSARLEVIVSKKYDKEAKMLDPDVRFLLANERTLLAWVRTALAVMAGGLALTQFGETSSQGSFGILAILFGAVMASIGYIRFRAADKSIRQGLLPDAGHGPGLQVLGVIIFALVIATVEIYTLTN